MTQRYEMLILATPEITQDELSELEKLTDKKVQESKGKLVSYDKWGKFQLAYPVRGNDYGIYILARFELPSEKAAQAIIDVRSLLELKFNTCVMRYLVTQLAAEAPLEYKRPLSLEETPRDVETFMKEDRGGSYREREGSARTSSMSAPARVSQTVQESASIGTSDTQAEENHG